MSQQKDSWLKMRVNTEMRESWKEAARSEGLSFSRWVTESLERSRAEISDKTDKAKVTRLERSQMLLDATPGVVRASTLTSPKRTFTPDFK